MKRFLLAVLGLAAVVFVSAFTAYHVARSQANVRFISAPPPANPDYGYLEINGKEYRQLYTTTEITNKGVPSGSHIHAIDLRTAK